jgi:hypothetical protein
VNGDGGWVVFLTGTGGHEAEFTVDRFEDRAVDAAVLAEAVADGLKEISPRRPRLLRAVRPEAWPARPAVAQGERGVSAGPVREREVANVIAVLARPLRVGLKRWAP